jgi:hypothetical protein
MSFSNTITRATTFTLTHAKYLGAKVATDLARLQRFYGQPSTSDIQKYETEVVELLKAGYLDSVMYGFRRGDKFIPPTLVYSAQELAGYTSSDDDPGRIQPGADVAGASFYSFLTYTDAWNQLTSGQKDEFKRTLPFYRIGAAQPGTEGYLAADLNYSSGGRTLSRKSLRAT